MSQVPLMPRTLTPFYDHWREGRVDPRRVRCGREALDVMEDAGRAPDPAVPARGPDGVWGRRWREGLEQAWPDARRLAAGLALFTDRLVFDLRVGRGRLDALVGDRSLQRVTILVPRLTGGARGDVLAGCAGHVLSVTAVLDGALPPPALELLAARLIPGDHDLRASCACGRDRCVHATAALYGLAARLDHDPAALFQLRGLSPADLYDAGAATTLRRRLGAAKARRILASLGLAGVTLRP